MTYNAARRDDPNVADGLIKSISQYTVFTNDLLQSIDGSTGTGHFPCPAILTHCAGAWVTDNGSDNVLVQDIAANFEGNPDTCGHKRKDGSPDVFINAGGNAIITLPIIDVSSVLDIPEVQSGVTEFEAAIHLKDDPDSDDGLAVFPSGTSQESINNGLIENLPEPDELETDDEETEPVEDVPADCGIDIYSEVTNYIFPGSFQLSPNYKLSDLTTDTVISNYSLQAQVGLTTNEIVCNLRLLCINVLEPLKAKYPSMFITSGFRHGSGGSQHFKGQAADCQFGGFTLDQYWEAAKWIKQNLPYDQFIYEYGRKPWGHISYIPGGRQQVLTRPSPGNYKPGLRRYA